MLLSLDIAFPVCLTPCKESAIERIDVDVRRGCFDAFVEVIPEWSKGFASKESVSVDTCDLCASL